MNINLGTLDRLLRAGLGLLLVVLAASGVVGFWGYLGAVLVVTAALSYCPVYYLFDVSTRGASQASPDDSTGRHPSPPGTRVGLPPDAFEAFEDHHERERAPPLEADLAEVRSKN